MSKSAEAIRSIVIDGVAYGWRTTHSHRAAVPQGREQVCVDKFTAFRKGSSAPLRILFAAPTLAGPIGAHGVCTLAPGVELHLHGPRTAEVLIRHAIQSGWSTERQWLIEDGLAFVEAMPFSLKRRLSETPTEPD